jgi:hypothetical protein
MNEKNPAISKGVDWSLAWIYLILVVVGITAIFAVTYKEGDSLFRVFSGLKLITASNFIFLLHQPSLGLSFY